MKSKIGNLERIENKDKHHLANSDYLHVFVYEGDEVVSLMLTEIELQHIKSRSQRNTDDIPELILPEVIVNNIEIKNITYNKGDIIIDL